MGYTFLPSYFLQRRKKKTRVAYVFLHLWRQTAILFFANTLIEKHADLYSFYSYNPSGRTRPWGLLSL
jgi:hypothetical protein